MQHRMKCHTARCMNPCEPGRGFCRDCLARQSAQRRARQTATTDTRLEERPTATQRGYSHQWHVFAKRFLLAHPTCAICGRPAQCVDHKEMTAAQMLDMYGRFVLDEDMYQALCFGCNTRKGRTIDRDRDSAYRKEKEQLEAGLAALEKSGRS